MLMFLSETIWKLLLQLLTSTRVLTSLLIFPGAGAPEGVQQPHLPWL